MKRLAIFAAVLLVIGAASYWAVRDYDLRRPMNQWAWMQQEFHLSRPQLLRIQALTAAYRPICVRHCSQVLHIRRKLAALEKAGRRNGPEYVRTLAAWADVKYDCEEATFKHIQAVASVMNPADGRRYLAITVPRIIRADGEEPVGIR